MARSAVVLELLSTMLDPGCDLGVLRDEVFRFHPGIESYVTSIVCS